MLLGEYYEGLEIHRGDKIIYGRFLAPHLVISTCRSGGGQRDDLAYLGNHQSCEPAGHSHGVIAAVEPDAYHEMVCLNHSLPPGKTALLGTAANMRLAAIKDLSFRDLTVVAAVTAGVEGNAGRAGDPAYGWEGPDGYEPIPHEISSADLEAHEAFKEAVKKELSETPAKVDFEPLGQDKADDSGADGRNPNHGTINTLLFISLPLTPGALARCVMTATEAKTAALEELGVNSRYSDGPATGTGTDQIGVAAKIVEGRRPLTSSGKHSKLGELVALAVGGALKEVLARQNGMTTERQRSVRILLERFHKKPDGHFGMETGFLLDLIASHLTEESASLMRANYRGLVHDPVIVAQVAAMVHVRDKFKWGILPWSVHSEVMCRQAALLAVEVGGRLDLYAEYHSKFASDPPGVSNDDFIGLTAKALALGFADKWPW